MNNPTTPLHELDKAGAPLFLVNPGKIIKGRYSRPPKGFPETTAANNHQVIDLWEDGYGVGMVCGSAYDVIDVDPRNGGEKSFQRLQSEGLLPEVLRMVDTPSGGFHVYVRPVPGITPGPLKGFPGIDFQGRGKFVFVPPSKEYVERERGRWPKFYTNADAPKALRRIQNTVSTAKVEADETPYDSLPAALQREARERVQRSISAFHELLAEAAEWTEGQRDAKGRGWERLTADAAFTLATLGYAAWSPLDIDMARERYEDMLPEVIRHDPKCADKWESQAHRAADRVPPAPWQERVAEAMEDFQEPLPPEPEPRPEHEVALDRSKRLDRLKELALDRLEANEWAKRTYEARQDTRETVTAVSGSSFLFDLPDVTPARWGNGTEILWARGESCMIVGPPGVGKTTLTSQVVRGLLGLQETVLGLSVQPAKRVLYLAMDRPQQIARAAARTFSKDQEHAAVIADRLMFWPGPPREDLALNQWAMLEMAQEFEADVIVVDSLKDAAVGLVEDGVGAGYNRARQNCLAHGVDVLELHHQKKAGTNHADPKTLADVYGSTWLTSGAGSVILLWGEAGDRTVELRHLKQPAEPVGPLDIVHDHMAGTSKRDKPVDLVSLAYRLGELTAKDAAAELHGLDFSAADKKATARRLDKLVSQGKLATVERSNSLNRPVRVYTVASPESDFSDDPDDLI